MGQPAYTRLPVEERRRLLLDLGAELFARYDYSELSMARIAREAGISKALLYHYFPTKRDFFAATLTQAAEELRERTQPRPEAPPGEALAESLDAFIAWIEERPLAYRRLIEGAASVPEVRAMVDEVRDRTAERILDGIGAGPDPAPSVRAAVRGWLWFMDGVLLDWLEHEDMDRSALSALLLGTLTGALQAAGAGELLAP
jgi:AcrR family transcriptional regulator